MQVFSLRFALFLLVAISCWLTIFWPAIVGMESIWRRSDTFAHGYFILPIALWLLYRDKNYLQSAHAQFTWLPLPFLLGCCVVWLFSYAADINVLSQLSAVVALIAVLWMMLGNQLAWRYKFPLAYLIFAVPMGENLIPMLQDITAWITVFLLKVHGIPVFRDGLYIQIPTGLFEVAVACSGIRYLIASLAVGTLFAYLTYNSFKKQLIFILFSLVLPIIANGIRAYLIVIIAHYSDMKYATGADHLVYGWVFFGFVIMLMFWIGGKFADPERNSNKTETEVTQQTPIIKNLGRFGVSPITSVTSLVLILGLTFLLQWRMPVVEVPSHAKQVLTQFPSVDKTDWGIAFNQPLAYGHVLLNDDVELAFAQYANKQNVGELINHANQLYDAERWTVVDNVANSGGEDTYQYLLLRDIQGRERAIVYWYQVSDMRLISETHVKLYQAFALMSGAANKASVIAVSTKNTEQPALIQSLLAQANRGYQLAMGSQ
ncbi:exosortase A [Colwellia sp. MEBiC06753]